MTEALGELGSLESEVKTKATSPLSKHHLVLLLYKETIYWLLMLCTFPHDNTAESQFNVLCDGAEMKHSEYSCQFLFFMF